MWIRYMLMSWSHCKLNTCWMYNVGEIATKEVQLHFTSQAIFNSLQRVGTILDKKAGKGKDLEYVLHFLTLVITFCQF